MYNAVLSYICKVFHSQYTFVIIMIVHIQQISSDAYH